MSSVPRKSTLPFLSLDGWAVLLSLALALLVRAGVIKTVVW